MAFLEDLVKECFLGFEDAGVEELRGMVRGFLDEVEHLGPVNLRESGDLRGESTQELMKARAEAATAVADLSALRALRASEKARHREARAAAKMRNSELAAQLATAESELQAASQKTDDSSASLKRRLKLRDAQLSSLQSELASVHAEHTAATTANEEICVLRTELASVTERAVPHRSEAAVASVPRGRQVGSVTQDPVAVVRKKRNSGVCAKPTLETPLDTCDDFDTLVDAAPVSSSVPLYRPHTAQTAPDDVADALDVTDNARGDFSMTDSTEALVDRLYDDCVEKAGGSLQGPAALRGVLLDLAGEGADDANLIEFFNGFCALEADSVVSRANFRALVGNAFAWRQSQDLQRLEGDKQFEPCESSTMERRQDPITWASLPSWSLEISRLSATSSLQVHVEGTAAEHWSSVQVALTTICSLAEGNGSDCTKLLQDLRQALAHFVRCFAEEARMRLRASRVSSGRLLDQRRRTIEDMGAQLEARDADFKRVLEEHMGRASKLRVAEDLAHTEEAMVAALTSELAAQAASRVDRAPREVMQELRESYASTLPTSNDLNTEHLAEMVDGLRDELSEALRERHDAEVGRRHIEKQLDILQNMYDEDAKTFYAKKSELTQSIGHGASLHDELDKAQATSLESAIQRARDAEEAMRREVHEVRCEISRREQEDRQKEEESALLAAAEAARAEERMTQMHGGTWFEKVAFHRQLKQVRFARLTFDLKRIEWGHRERGPMKSLAVNAIVRVDFGDASRTFRAFEFGKVSAPPSRCFSISTPSRSLDLIAQSERDVEVWVLGLNEVVPYSPLRHRLTTQDFHLRRTILRMDCGGDDCKDDASVVSTATGGTSVRSVRSGTPTSTTSRVRQFLNRK